MNIFHILLVLNIVVMSFVSCRLGNEYVNHRGKIKSKVQDVYFKRILEKIENNTFNDSDIPHLVQLIQIFLKRKNAIDQTPPVYWYSRKG
jgi:hypothetical protein